MGGVLRNAASAGCGQGLLSWGMLEKDWAADVLKAEGEALAALEASLRTWQAGAFTRAVDVLAGCVDRGGTVLVSGLGKSGLIGAKISATMSSVGIPCHSVHPSEAAHGDLGRFRASDAVVCISNSGETAEVVNLAALLKQDGLPIVSVTGTVADDPARKGSGSERSNPERSSLERLATVSLGLCVQSEAGGPQFVAPTSSTTNTLALGDALSLAIARRRNFTDEDFAKRHPGGSLGGLLRPITDVLRCVAGKNLPVISDALSVEEALRRASEVGRRPGAMILVDERGVMSGIFTDGDLRRLVLRDAHELSRPVRDVMTRSPRRLPDSALVRDAVLMIREFRQDEIPVVDGEGKPVGLLDVQDLVAMRLVQE